MSASINIANVISVDMEGAKGVFVIDQGSGKVYKLPLEEADAETTGRVSMAVYGQMRRDMPNMPHDQIAEVMRAKKGVIDEGRKPLRRSNG